MQARYQATLRPDCHFLHRSRLSHFMVPRVGVEPTLHRWNQILSLARLPIPPSGPGGTRKQSEETLFVNP
jgi:hypothetical protein